MTTITTITITTTITRTTATTIIKTRTHNQLTVVKLFPSTLVVGMIVAIIVINSNHNKKHYFSYAFQQQS